MRVPWTSPPTEPKQLAGLAREDQVAVAGAFGHSRSMMRRRIRQRVVERAVRRPAHVAAHLRILRVAREHGSASASVGGRRYSRSVSDFFGKIHGDALSGRMR